MTAEATIVVPLLTQKDDWLRQCVRSALTQTAPCEVIVVVSCRTPRSNLEVLESFARRFRAPRIVRRRQEGFAAAINTGIDHARTGRVGLLLSDDWLSPAAVEACLTHSTDIVSTGRAGYAPDGVTELPGLRRTPSWAEYDRLATLEARAGYLGHFFLFRKEPLLRIGGVDQAIGLTGADDYDMIWTLLEHGAGVSIVESCHYYYRDHHGDRLTLRDPRAQIADLEKIMDKHGVHGRERERLIETKSAWFGRPVHEVVYERRRQSEGPGTTAGDSGQKE